MGDKIAMGFHSAVDYELEWDAGIITKLASAYGIRDEELDMKLPIKSERDLLVVTLWLFSIRIGGNFQIHIDLICNIYYTTISPVLLHIFWQVSRL